MFTLRENALDRAMASRTKISLEEALMLEGEFKERFSFLYSLFEKTPFSLPSDEKKSARVSAAIYDAMMVASNQLWESRERIQQDKMQVISRMTVSLHNSAQVAILTGYGNTAQAVRERITLAGEILFPKAQR